MAGWIVPSIQEQEISMKVILSRRLVLLGLALLLVQAALPALTAANHAFPKRFHWQREQNPFTLQLVDNVTPEWNQALDRAANGWTRSSVLNLKVVNGNDNRNCRGNAGRVEVCNRNFGNTGFIGITFLKTRDRHIKTAVAFMNDFYFSRGQNDPSLRLSVMCHELGHTIGLGHVRGRGSCMTQSVNHFPTTPDRHDYDELEKIYEHTDDRTTIDGESVAGAEPAFNLSFPARGDSPPAITVEDLGGGWQQITIIDYNVPAAS